MLPFGRLWYAGPNAVSNAIGYAEHYSRSHDAVIRVYDEAGNVIETHELNNEKPFIVTADEKLELSSLSDLVKATNHFCNLNASVASGDK